MQGGARGPVTTLQLELDNVIFNGLSISSGGDLPGLSESLNFSGYTQTVWDMQPDGNLGSPDVFSDDISRNLVRSNAQPAASVAGFGQGLLAPVAVPIPEPQTWVLMAGGIAMLSLLRQRRPG